MRSRGFLKAPSWRAATRSSPSRACRTRWSRRSGACSESRSPFAIVERERHMPKPSSGTRTSRRSQAPRASAKRADKSGGGRRKRVLQAAPNASGDRPAGRTVERQVVPMAPVADTTARGKGKYVYCVIRSNKSLQFGLSAIAGEVGNVHTVNYKDLAAVVSDVPIGPLDSTRENVLAHEHVNEIVMRDHTVIPMSFGTIFKTREDALELLRSAHDAFDDVLSKMQNKLEFGLKVLWDRDAVISEIEQ